MEPIPYTKGYMANLLTHVESKDILKKYGHMTQPLSDEQLSKKQRCRGCNLKPHQFQKSEKRIKKNALKSGGAGPGNAGGGKAKIKPKSRAGRDVLNNTFLCQFHPGKVINKHWTCCSKHVSAHPCSGAKTHDLNTKSLRELANMYQFLNTPQYKTSSSRGHVLRPAVALDCEMGTSATGDSELIRISMIDYFTGEVLVNSLVDPTVTMRTLNTKWSGVSWDDLSKARKEENCIQGMKAARDAVWAHVGPETVVVGHAVHNDLRTLRWIHTCVVHSYLIASKEKKKKKKGSGKMVSLSLKKLMKQGLDKDVQTSSEGHDSLEDAIATRDLVHWQITQPRRG